MSYGLGELIQERRRELGLSQQELARRMGIPTANLSTLEHTVTRWQSRLIVALSTELKVPQIELAIAAGMLTDLPAISTERSQLDPDDMFLSESLPNDEESAFAEKQMIVGAIDRLPPGYVQFLAILVEQLLVRHPSSAIESAALLAQAE